MSSADARMQAAVIERASEWYARHRDGQLSPQEADAFLQWLQASPLHVREYLAAASLSESLAEAVSGLRLERQQSLESARRWLSARGNVIALHPNGMAEPAASAAPARTGRRVRRAHISIAASIILLVSVAIGIALRADLGKPGVSGWPRAVETVSGEKRTIRLRDGSVMHLDADTRVHVRYSGERRLIELDHGRAMFSVARNAGRPFVVLAGAAEVMAVGTRFDVHRDGSQGAVTVTVVEGKVALLDRKAPIRDAAHEVRPSYLVAGQQAQLARASSGLRTSSVDVRQATAWLRHELVFSERPLGEVAAELSRYGVPIEIDDRALREYRVNGVFDAYDSESFVAFLARLGEVERSTAGIRVRARRP